jgi:hypothetical protein
MNKKEFVEEIAKLRPGSTFLVLHKYQNASGELADFNIVFNMSYENALERSIAIVEKFKPQGELQERAQLEVLESFKKSLHRVRTVPIQDVDDAYYRYFDENGKLIDCIKLHMQTDILHMFGLLNMKRVHVPGVYKKVNSRDLTIEKKKIQKLCPLSRFRQFKLHHSQLEMIRVQQLTLLPPDAPLDDEADM